MSSERDERDGTGEDELAALEKEARNVPEDRQSYGRGPEVLREHLEEAARRKKQLTIRLDRDIVTRFKQLAGPEGSYQTLMNRALHDWLEAQSVKELLRGELQEFGELVEELKAGRGSAEDGKSGKDEAGRSSAGP